MSENKLDPLVEREASQSSNASHHEPHASDSVQSEEQKQSIPQRLWRTLKTPGSALQIIVAAAIALAIGLSVSSTVTEIPEAVPVILGIPGQLWLRALSAVVLPLIVCAIILAMQNLKKMAQDGAKLARWTIGYYVLTTILAVVHSQILTALVWQRLMVPVSGSALEVSTTDQSTIDERTENAPHDIVVNVFNSFIPNNVIGAFANNELLAVLVTACIVGLLIKGAESSILKAVTEIERIVYVVIVFLISIAPIGVFFLILSNVMRLDIQDIGLNLGILIGGSVCGMAIHVFIVLPMVYFAFVRRNPYRIWIRCSSAWITAWGTASSAATLPITIRCLETIKVPQTIVKFTAPLGCLINMDGTAIYFPMVVVFLAATQGHALNAGDYVVIVLLSTLSSIATTPIPSSSLVLTVMMANSVDIPITGMYAVVVAIDWFIDRFRTLTNVSGDIYAAKVLEKVTGIKDENASDLEDSEHQIENGVGNSTAQEKQVYSQV